MIKEVYFAGGCFWGVQHYFGLIDGVTETTVGYANGSTKNPTYEEVCRGNTGHSEAVRVLYDDKKISLLNLLEAFFDIIDPTTINRQGNDFGTQYRSGIYYADEEDKETITNFIIQQSPIYKNHIAVEIAPLENFYSAEEYHQKYLIKNPCGYCHISKEKFEKAKKR
jgi:methionine-S-sulfoxide reductase